MDNNGNNNNNNNNNWRPAQADPPPNMDPSADWRNQLQSDSRNRIVNKIMVTLKRHLSFSGQDGLQELRRIAVRLEEKIYTTATSQTDYLRKISLKMLTVETKSQNTIASNLSANSAGNNRTPADSVVNMDNGNNNNWRPAQADPPPNMDASADWRITLRPDSRNRIVNKILETLKRHLPFSGQDGLQELAGIAVRFEEKVYTAATSQPDYLRKISSKMLSMEMSYQNSIARNMWAN